MCSVSMVADHYKDWYPSRFPNVFPSPPTSPAQNIIFGPAVSREEFDALKRDVEQMKDLLARAKEYDERNGEPDCEMDEKMDLLRKVAKLVGIDLDDVIGRPA